MLMYILRTSWIIIFIHTWKKKREQNNADTEGKISVNLKQGYTFLGYVLYHSKQLITIVESIISSKETDLQKKKKTPKGWTVSTVW